MSCKGVLKKNGENCSRKPMEGLDFCYQHGKNPKDIPDTIGKKFLTPSYWILTINPNKRWPTRTNNEFKDFKHKFENACHLLGRKMRKFIRLKANSIKRGDTLSRDFITQFEYKFVLEIAPKTDTLHAHIFIKMRHRLSLELMYDEIKSFFCKQLDLPNLYFNGHVASSASYNFEKYLEKGNFPIKEVDVE